MAEYDSETEFFTQNQIPSKASVSDISRADKVSVVEYFFLVTFNWDLMVGNPFEINVAEVVNDFPESWIKGPLTRMNRQRKITVIAFGGGQYSLFCKVQKGIL